MVVFPPLVKLGWWGGGGEGKRTLSTLNLLAPSLINRSINQNKRYFNTGQDNSTTSYMYTKLRTRQDSQARCVNLPLVVSTTAAIHDEDRIRVVLRETSEKDEV